MPAHHYSRLHENGGGRVRPKIFDVVEIEITKQDISKVDLMSIFGQEIEGPRISDFV